LFQSPNDTKQYRTSTLSNGLRVLLIENAQSTKSAAALAVNVGHFSDPKDRQGLAHFLEHMLFLGTEKYPDGSEYQKFISQHNGSHNAWTGTEHTCFYFDIGQQYFTDAIARFSEFFISPLLSEEYINKERQNIDSEFKLKLKDEMRRLYDVHKETINPEHPFSQFSVGNIDTLADRNNVSIQQEVASFFNQHYRANYMTLAIEGPQSLDELSILAEQYFSKISPAQQPLKTFTQELYLPENQKICIQVKPVKNDRQLLLSFAMPSIDNMYRNKPESILAYLLGHEGPGSILSFLKKNQWAFQLTAGSGINGSNFKDFNISIALTELGEQHVDDIVETIFSYIKLLKSDKIPRHYFDEKKSIAMFSFQYQERMKPLDSVSHYVITMQHYPEEDYIFGDYVMDKMCDDSLHKLLNYLSVENSRLIIISQQAIFDKISRWYKVPYHVEDMSSQQLERWCSPPNNQQLFLPPKNEFIIDSPEIVEQEQTQNIPSLLIEKPGFSCWFKQDQYFKVPKGYIYLGIDCPQAIESAKNIAMTRLFIELYSDNIIEENYDAELAGIHYHLYPHQGGMTLQLSGVSEKQPLLLAKLLNALNTQVFTEEKFELFKAQLMNHWNNADTSKSISQLFSILSSTMQPKKPSSETLATALETITFTTFNQFYTTLFQRVCLELFIHGNWRQTTALSMCELIEFHFEDKIDENHCVNVEAIDNSGLQEVVLPLVLPEHDHAAVIYYPMSNKDIPTMAITMVLSQLLSPHFFQEMRTEKQFGYLVGVGYVPIGHYPGLAMYIQSPHTQADILVQAIDDFTTNTLSIIEKITEQDWQQLQHGLASQLLENDVSLRIKSQRFWGSLSNKDYQFNRKKQLIESINKMNIDDIKNFINTKLISTKQQDRITLISTKNDSNITFTTATHQVIESPEMMQKICKYKF
jgi:secreted Zn-dependent insulinase-like peptidase